jgi:glycosyltransferase involved in cell wall biosynthesis
VGFGGRLVPEKGMDVLLRAAASLPRVRVLVLGDGPERVRLEQLARSLGLDRRVHFAGHVGSIELARWLSSLDSLALPSRTAHGWTEQFGRILIEAMACGVPVVASGSGEIPHVIGDAGVLVAEGDPVALAAALASLTRDTDRCASLALAGQRRVLERFTHAAVADATAAFYRQLLRSEDGSERRLAGMSR